MKLSKLFTLIAIFGMLAFAACTSESSGDAEMEDAAKALADSLEASEEALNEGLNEAGNEGQEETDGEEVTIEYSEPDLKKISREAVIPYAAAEVKPTTLKCADETADKKRQRCLDRFISNYLNTNLEYPDAAEKAGIEGKVIVQFVVQEDGNIGEVTLLRSAIPGGELETEAKTHYQSLDEEALRVIGTIPQMAAGSQGGKAVDIAYAIPVSFVIR